MSNDYHVYSLEHISEESFINLVESAGGRYTGYNETREEHGAQIDDSENSSILIYLEKDAVNDINEKEDEELIAKIGGSPVSSLIIEPAGGFDYLSLVEKFLFSLSSELEYVVTDFDRVLMTGKELHKKKGLV